MDHLQQIAAWLSDARATVAFTGAGISTESGIPDFRSPGGIWSQSQPVYYDEFLAKGGKRSRPFITLAVYDAMTGGRGTLAGRQLTTQPIVCEPG